MKSAPVRLQWEGSHLQTKERSQKPTLLATSSQASSFQNCKKTNFCCLSHPVCGILLQQLKLTNTVSNAWCLENTDIPSVFSGTSCFKCPLSLETGFDLPVFCCFVWLWFLLKGNIRLRPIWPSFYHRYVTIWFSIFSFNISCNYFLQDFLTFHHLS